MKKALAILLAVCMLVPLVAALPVSAATPTEGYTFGADKWYYADGALSDAPRTVEAWIYVDPNHATETRTVISNYNGFTVGAYWHLAVKYDYQIDGNTTSPKVLFPYFEWNELSDNSTGLRKYNFRNTVITPGEWTHIAIVIDAENNCCRAYKNGAHVQRNNAGIWLGDITKNVSEQPLAIGNDCRTNLPDSRVFQGSIASISLFNDVRTAEEIASDYANGADYNDENALAHWELPASGAPVVDQSGNGVGLTLSQYWLTEAEMAAIRGNSFNPAYSFAVVGDVQYMVRNDASRGTNYTATVYNWIKNNVATKNIQYVMGMGDVTNHCVEQEWSAAYDAIKVLNGAVPYSVINGNHDWYTYTVNESSTSSVAYPFNGSVGMGPTAIDQYFGADETYMSQFTGDNGGLYEEGSVRNTYYEFTVGTTDWLVINLDYSPSDDILKWANQVVAAHPNHKVIMTTHGYLHVDGTPISDENSGSMTYNNGEEMWTKFVSLHENIVMVLSGHMESNLIMMKQAKGVHGNTVTQFLIDQQTVDYNLMEKGLPPLGLVAMFYFDESGENVSVEWYSTTYDKYFQTRNQISFNMNNDENVADQSSFPWNGMSIAPKGSGTESDPYIVENGGNLLWMANQVQQIDLSAGGTPNFEDTYFKQICDIDLAGLVIKSIGYYHTSQGGIEKVAAFAGHYDGGGYSIKNGRVIEANSDHSININWTTGLFGCIYGATIENVTLDNVTIWSRGVTGGIVGRATAPRNVDAPSDFNVISNCHVKESCRLVSIWKNDESLNTTEYGYNTRYRAGVVGPICGIAYATTITGCTSAVEFEVDGEHSMAGGIAGMAGYNTVIENCAFTGGITLTDMNTTVSPTFGGIVGLLAPNLETETMNYYDDYLGTLTIRNCYNSGYFVYTGADALPEGLEMHWGGILGHATKLEKVTADKLYLIENCYNLYAKEIETVLADDADYWIGGIVGKADAGNYDTWDSLTVKNCASVAITANGGNAEDSTNEYRTTGIRSMYGKLPVLAENVTTATVETINGKLEAIRLEMLIRQNAQNGTKWYYGEGAPAVDANVGDMYLDTASGDVYVLELTWQKVGNIKGDKGEQGNPGEKGEDGKNAVAPTIEIINGYWYVNGESLGVKAEGANGKDAVAPTIEIKDGYWYINGENTEVKAEGKDGVNGENGKDAVAPTIEIKDGYWYINGENTEVKAEGKDGANGENGKDANRWYFGETAPTALAGAIAGDMYMNTTDGKIYQYSGTAWSELGCLKGDKGDTGDAGTINGQITINSEGYWCIDGISTGVSALGQKGENGTNGTDGKDGNTWTVGEGAPEGSANAGDMYYDKTDCNVYQYTDGAWTLIGNIKGADGEDGADGADGEDGTNGINGTNGADGKDGNTWTVGEGAPEGSANAGNMYYDKTDCNVYQYTDGAWTLLGNIKGADGEDGADGADGEDGTNGTNGTDGKDGNTWTVGEGAPEGSANAGDMYYDKTDCNVYQYKDGAWTLLGNIKGADGEDGVDGADGADGEDGKDGTNGTNGTNGKDGEDGEDGSKWFTGETDPVASSDYKVGDMYMNTTTGDVFRYNGTAWETAGNLTGPEGPKGDKGDTGATGATGAQGEKGDKGDKGDKGEDGADAAVSDSANTAGGTNNAGNTSTSDDKGGNGLAIAAIVIAVMLGAANAALVIVLMLKKKKA